MKKVQSWGLYPPKPQISHACYWRHDLKSSMINLASQYQTTLPFGNGRSYGDSCLAASNHVLNMRHLNRFIQVDWEKGIIQAEAGVTLGEILQVSIPQGWFLPVTPGTQYVTLGGAIANDVHGKNHHIKGTFGRYVEAFALNRSSEGEMICSPEKNADLFKATIGGLGLTGVISWATLQLIPIASPYIETTSIRYHSLEDFFSLSQTFDATHEYTVAWVDCLAKKPNLGRGIFMAGKHASPQHTKPHAKRKIAIPVTSPVSLINPLTVSLFNQLYFTQAKNKTEIIHFEPFFYPLDKILYWNRLYGKKGFQQYQCVIPKAVAKEAITLLLSTIASSKSGSFLTVLKQCGSLASPGLLSFPMEGVSLALDFPQSAYLGPLFQRLDSITKECGGRLYPAKDAHMKGEDFRHFYPNWVQLEALRDPTLCSQFWKRVINS